MQANEDEWRDAITAFNDDRPSAPMQQVGWYNGAYAEGYYDIGNQANYWVKMGPATLTFNGHSLSMVDGTTDAGCVPYNNLTTGSGWDNWTIVPFGLVSNTDFFRGHMERQVETTGWNSNVRHCTGYNGGQGNYCDRGRLYGGISSMPCARRSRSSGRSSDRLASASRAAGAAETQGRDKRVRLARLLDGNL